MLDWNRIRVSMKEFCPFAGRNDEISDEQSQLMPLLFGMPYHREAYGEVAPPGQGQTGIHPAAEKEIGDSSRAISGLKQDPEPIQSHSNP